MELEELPPKFADAIRISMERNGTYQYRVYALSFWSILLGITCLAVVRCLLQLIGLCDDDGMECFAGMVTWMAPLNTEDITLFLILMLVFEIMVGSIIIHAIKKSNFGFSIFGTVWILFNAVIILWNMNRSDVWWRYLVVAVLCITTFCFQLCYCKNLRRTIKRYKENLGNRVVNEVEE